MFKNYLTTVFRNLPNHKLYAVINIGGLAAGLAAYSAEQRTLEIGIRKVMGARIPDILSLIGAELLRSVIWANVIAWPIVYLLLRNWLDAYEYRIDISPLIFVFCGLLAVVLAWLSVGWQVFCVLGKRRFPSKGTGLSSVRADNNGWLSWSLRNV